MKGAASKVPSRPPPLLVLPFQVGFRGPYAPTGGGGIWCFGVTGRHRVVYWEEGKIRARPPLRGMQTSHPASVVGLINRNHLSCFDAAGSRAESPAHLKGSALPSGSS